MTTTIAVPVRERPIPFSGAMIRALAEGRKTQTRRLVKASPGEQARWLTPERLLEVPMMEIAYVGDALGAQMAHPMGGPGGWVRCRYGKPGDRLWVREMWGLEALGGFGERNGVGEWSYEIQYAADGDTKEVMHRGHHSEDPYVRLYDTQRGDHRPSIHMPRWASRFLLEVVSVRVERLQLITDADAIAEGARELRDLPVPSPHPYGLDLFWTMEDPADNRTCLGSPRWAFANYLNKLHGGENWNVKRGHTPIWDQNPWVWVVEFKRITE